MRALWTYLRQLLAAKNREVAAIESVERRMYDLLEEWRLNRAQFEDMVGALEGIQELLANQGPADVGSVAWHVGVPQPEEE